MYHLWENHVNWILIVYYSILYTSKYSSQTTTVKSLMPKGSFNGLYHQIIQTSMFSNGKALYPGSPLALDSHLSSTLIGTDYCKQLKELLEMTSEFEPHYFYPIHPCWLEFMKSKILSLVENFSFLMARENKYSPGSVVWKVNCIELDDHCSIPRLARVWKGSGFLTHSQGGMEVDTTPMAEREEELKILLKRMKEEGEKAGLKLNTKKN